MVKNNQVARDTEESKWINLCENINKEYPDVVIELWDETSIQEKLCLPETQGCYRYWFEYSDVFETEILTSYQRAINSWAKTKYIPICIRQVIFMTNFHLLPVVLKLQRKI